MANLSIIIPVYKAENTLDRCIKSVLAQDIEEIELILINDGSPDKSPELCDEWCKKDSRIKVVHKKNGGPGSARNAGLEVCTGEYVTFIDSDDYLLSDTYSPLMSYLLNNPEVDMLEFNLQHEDKERIPLNLQDHLYQNPKDYWLQTRTWTHGYVCNKIFRRSLFKGIHFGNERICEDLLVIPKLLKLCKKIYTTQHGFYVYTDNESGLSKVITRKNSFKALRSNIKVAWMMRTVPWDKNGRNLYYYMCCRMVDIIRLTFKPFHPNE